jgi:GNAT superfamily N-acetyltransferase
MEDAAILAYQRAAMFRDMGVLSDDLFSSLATACQHYFTRALPTGEYVGWIATADENEIVGGAGLQLRQILPRPDLDRARIITGPQAIVLNVYTEPAWRRRGVANRLMQHVLDWTSAHEIESVVLHAAPEARALYEKLGFVPTNEMRLALR